MLLPFASSVFLDDPSSSRQTPGRPANDNLAGVSRASVDVVLHLIHPGYAAARRCRSPDSPCRACPPHRGCGSGRATDVAEESLGQSDSCMLAGQPRSHDEHSSSERCNLAIVIYNIHIIPC